MINKILIINGHPDNKSYNYALSKKYAKAAENTGAEVNFINITELNFVPFFKGFDKELNLEDDLIKAQNRIKEAKHLVFIFPIWWATMPALLKSFIERTFVPGFAGQSKNKREFRQWANFLAGKTARIIITMDSPPLYYIFKVKNPAYNALKDILNFCGIKSIKKTYIGPVKVANDEQLQRWLRKVERLGKKHK